MTPSTSGQAEELLAEIMAMRRLVDSLKREIERLNRQFDRTEEAAQRVAAWRSGSVPLWPPSGRDDDGGSD